MDVNVGSSNFTGQDFSLTIHFKQTIYAATSTVFAYKSNVEVNNMITEFKLLIENGTLLRSKKAYGTIEQKGFAHTIDINTWYSFIVGVTRSNGRYQLYLDNTHIENDDNYILDQCLETPGVVRLGADHAGGNHFAGSFICMGVSAKKQKFANIDDIRDFCNSTNWLYQPSGELYLSSPYMFTTFAHTV